MAPWSVGQLSSVVYLQWCLLRAYLGVTTPGYRMLYDVIGVGRFIQNVLTLQQPVLTPATPNIHQTMADVKGPDHIAYVGLGRPEASATLACVILLDFANND